MCKQISLEIVITDVIFDIMMTIWMSRNCRVCFISIGHGRDHMTSIVLGARAKRFLPISKSD